MNIGAVRKRPKRTDIVVPPLKYRFMAALIGRRCRSCGRKGSPPFNQALILAQWQRLFVYPYLATRLCGICVEDEAFEQATILIGEHNWKELFDTIRYCTTIFPDRYVYGTVNDETFRAMRNVSAEDRKELIKAIETAEPRLDNSSWRRLVADLRGDD